MCDKPCCQCLPLPSLSDEAAVEIRDFLAVFTINFECQYSNKIRRYYDQRSRHNIVQTHPTATNDDPPF